MARSRIAVLSRILAVVFLTLNTLQTHVVRAESLLCSMLVRSKGYPCTEYNVTTADGYILALQRIPYGRHSPQPGEPRPVARSPVFLLHGLMMGGEAWVLNEEGQALGPLLADAGFDVFLGNTRGSRWSHGHTVIPTTAKAYWDWSWEELAAFDLPSLLRAVGRLTGGQQVIFIGHSQGTLVALTALQDAEVARQVAAAVLLSPIAYLGNLRSQFCHAAADLFLDRTVAAWGWVEVNLNNKLGEALVGATCLRPKVDCSSLLTALTGPNCCVNMTRAAEFFDYLPSSTSVKNMGHLAQMVRTGRWQRYDYGWVNYLHYGTFKVPEVDAKKVSTLVPLALVFGAQDFLSVEADVRLLAEKLKGRQVDCPMSMGHKARAKCQKDAEPTLIEVPNYAHADFVLSVSLKEDLFRPILNYLQSALPHAFTPRVMDTTAQIGGVHT